MVFRELCADEVALLNESERMQYEKQLQIYHERTSFVEKLEQIENANIQYTKPKLKRIKPVPKLEIPKYKSVGIIKIKLPKEETNRNLFLQQLENNSVNTAKIRERISENSAVRVKIKPIPKLIVPSLKPYHNFAQQKISLSKPKVVIPSVSFNEKSKHLIHGISEYTKKISVPQCEFTEMMPIKITEIQKKNVPVITPMNFKYEKTAVVVSHHAIALPKSVKFNFDGSVKIKNMPSPPKVDVSDKIFRSPKCEVKDVPKINVIIPEVKFEKSKHKIQNMPQMQIPALNYDFSTINRQIQSDALGKVQPFKKQMPSVPSIKSYKKPKCTVFNLPLKPVSIPSVNQFTSPPRKSVTVIAPSKVKEPKISTKPLKKIEIETDKIPKVNTHTPEYSEIDVNNILNIVRRELQGV